VSVVVLLFVWGLGVGRVWGGGPNFVRQPVEFEVRMIGLSTLNSQFSITLRLHPIRYVVHSCLKNWSIEIVHELSK
jgi:hypothetical protein